MGSIKLVFCWIFGHDYQVWQHFNHTSRRVVCERCGGDWGMNDSVRAFVPWSGELAEIYEMQGKKIRPRRPLQAPGSES